MDGLYSVFFLISTLISIENPLVNGFPEGEARQYSKISFSKVEFQNKFIGNEIQYSRYLDKRYGPLQPSYSLSLTDENGLWGGAGFIRKLKINDKFSFNLDFYPGIYVMGKEEDLGGWLMFRSGVELEYKVNYDWNVALSYDHRSSGDIWKYNPGMETLKFSISKNY